METEYVTDIGNRDEEIYLFRRDLSRLLTAGFFGMIQPTLLCPLADIPAAGRFLSWIK
jgi:hypothetical protein